MVHYEYKVPVPLKGVGKESVMLKKSVCILLCVIMIGSIFLITSPKAEAATYTSAQWKDLAGRFKVYLCGDSSNDMTNSSVKAMVTTIDNNCTTYWTQLKNMRSAGVTKGLFDASIDDPNEMGWQYIYLWYMARAYGTSGSQYYKNADLLADIIYGIDVMENKFYTTSALKTAQATPATFNWWDWAYNAPMHLCRILFAIREDLTTAKVSTYGYSSVKSFVYTQLSRMESMINTVKPVTGISDEFLLYENRRIRLISWIMLATLRGCYASSDSELTTAATMMSDSHTALKDFFQDVTAGADGVNPDGSYICHEYFAMEGTYGVEVVVDRLIPAYTILSGTVFEPTSANCEILAKWMLNTFHDVTRNGVVLSMNIGRYPESGVSKGIALIKGALQLIGCFDTTEELELRQMIRDMVPQSRYASYASNLGDVRMVQTLYDVVFDETVEVEREEYAVMRYTTDRAIQHTDSYTVGLAMSSTRIATHDCTNGRNRYGWYTGDGMLYVYNDATGFGFDPYGSNYHKYANMYRMPGTTEENSTRRIPNSCRNHYLPRTDFVGGVELKDQYITAALDFDAYTWSSSDSSTYDNFTPGTNGQTQKKQVLTSNLEANKSYFMFDNEIVCVGSGINFSTNSNSIYTFVNNMELRESATIDGTSIVGTEDIVVDGNQLDKAQTYTKSYTNPKWIYQEKFGGYYFPSNAKVTLNKTARTTVNDYNLDTSGKSTVTADGKTHSFLELWVDHGSKPSGGTYSYVMLPEMTQAQTQAYSANPDISILSSNNTVHVVKEKTLGITGYVFWKAGTYGDITVSQPMILMVQEKDGAYSISVSDPTHKLSSGTVTIKKALTQVSNDSKITVKNGTSSTTLTVNFSGGYGRSYEAEFLVGGPNYLFFDFQNTTADKARYNNTAYGAYNFDTAGWKYNTAYVSGQSYATSSGIGTTTLTLISEKANPYVQTVGSTDSFNATPLSFSPAKSDVCVIRFKMQNCALTSGATTPQVRLYYIKDKATTGVANSDYISATFDATALSSNQYITVTIPTNDAFRGASSINAIRPVFFNVCGESGKTATITIDSIYVGPKQSGNLFFDFTGDGNAQTRYTDPAYSGNNYDSGYWGFNSGRADSLSYTASGVGTLDVTMQKDGTSPYIQTTDRSKSLTAIAMNYVPTSAEVAVIRFKMKGLTLAPDTTSASVRFTYGKNNEGVDLASSKSFSATIPTSALNSGEYLTLVVPVNEDFKTANTIHALRVSWPNVANMADSVGRITVDYIYVGSKTQAPIPEYTVTFKNHDGTVLQTSKVKWGESASYTAATPTRSADSTNHYTFKSWDKELTDITADTVITAQYTATAHTWTYSKVDSTNHKMICTCGYSKNETHSYTYKVTKNPTASAAGTLTGTCSKCSGTTTVSLPILNTTDYTKTVTKAPTCTAPGSDKYTWNTTTYGTFAFDLKTETLGHSIANGTCTTCKQPYKGTLLHFTAGSPELDFAWNVIQQCSKPTFDTTVTGLMKGTVSAPGGDTRTDIYIGMQGSSNPDNLKHTLLTGDEIFQIRFKLDVDITIPANSRYKIYLKTDDVTEAGSYSETYRVYTEVSKTDAQGYTIATMNIPESLVGKVIETLRIDFIDLIGFVAVEGTYAIDYIYIGPDCTAPDPVHTCNYTVTTAPKETATGLITGICEFCAYKHTVTLPVLSTTDYTKTVTKAATCTAPGVDTYTWKTTDYGTFAFTLKSDTLGHSVIGGVCTTCKQPYTGTLLHFNADSPELDFAWNHLRHCTAPTFDTTGTGLMKGTISAPGGDTATDIYLGMQATSNPDNLKHTLLSGDEVFQIRFKLDVDITVPANSRFKIYLKTDDVTHASSYSETYKVYTESWKVDAQGYTVATMHIPETMVGRVVETLRIDFCDLIGKVAVEGTYAVDYIYIGPGCTAPDPVHTYTYAVTTQPNLSATGVLTGSCQFCTNKVSVTLPKLTTTDYTKTTTKAPTCTESGTDKYTWKTTTYGSFSFNVTTAAKGHTEVIDKAVAATCTANGLTEGKHCSVCNVVLTAQTTVAATGHSYTYKASKNPTTAATGTLTGTCSKCSITTTVTLPKLTTTDYTKTTTKAPTCTETGTDKYTWKTTTYGSFSFNVTTAAKGHTEVIDKAVAPTCTATGLTEGKHCSVCNAALTAQTTVAALGHSYKNVVTAPTCTAQGYTTHTCSRCSDSYKDTYVSATGHSYTYKATKNPTTSATGTLTGTCSKCSITTTVTLPKLTTTDYTVTTTKAPTCTATGTDKYTWKTTTYGSFYFDVTTAAKGHTEVIDKAVAATCTASGLTEGKHCSVCNTVLVAQTTVAAKGHTEVIDKAVAATCTTTGKTEGKHCSVCNTVLVAQTTVAAKGHTEVIDKAVAATCTTTGKTEGKHCSVCNTVLVAQTTVAATGHNYDTGTVTTKPTFTEKGIMTYTCLNDSAHTTTKSLDVLQKSIFFGFDNTAQALERYDNYVYGFVNFDSSSPMRWKYYSGTVSSVAIDNTAGTATICAQASIPETDWPGVYMETSKPLAYYPHGEAYFQIRFKMDNFRIGDQVKTNSSGTQSTKTIDPYVKLSVHADGASGAIAATIDYPIDKTYINSGTWFVATIPVNEAFMGAEDITSVRAYFGGIESISDTQIGEVVIDYIFVGAFADLPTPAYTVTFTDGAGNTLGTTLVSRGETATYTATTPTKISDATNHYTFTGWDKALTNITEDCTFTAIFTADAHYYIDGVCTCGKEGKNEPVQESKWKIGHTLNLASDISVNLAVSKSLLSGFDMDTVYILAEIDLYTDNEKTDTKTVKILPVEQGNYYYFTLSGLTAINMNDSIRSVLHGTKDGQEYYSPVDEYSIATYAYSQMNKEGTPATLKTLCADLLRYGTKAQIFKNYRTNELADSKMTDTHKAYLSDMDAVVFGNTNKNLDDLASAPIKWAGKALILDSKVCLKFIFTKGTYVGAIADLTLHVSYTDTYGATKEVVLADAELYNEKLGYYAFTLDTMLAAELRSVVSVQVYAGNTPVSCTLQYSADTYGNNKTGALLDVCKALFAYSDSAKSYFGG